MQTKIRLYYVMCGELICQQLADQNNTINRQSHVIRIIANYFDLFIINFNSRLFFYNPLTIIIIAAPPSFLAVIC